MPIGLSLARVRRRGRGDDTLAREIPWEDFTESVPAFLIVLGIPLTLSVADGLSLGFIFYPLLKLTTGRHRDVHPALYVLALAAILRYSFL